ncbi:MAG: protein kinase [Anaerolineales bacterium]|nr:protein kinase [Anaerolineales bacterium]
MTSKFFARLSQSLQKNKTAPPPKLEVGALINERYRLDAEIGRGGMGIVYRAHDIPNNRDVAVKVVNFDAANILTLQQFLREAEISARLDHPHIVAVYEVGAVDIGAPEPLPFIVMELAQGTNLADMSGFTYARIIEIGKQICDALEYAHNQGLVYRDLKPGNIIVEKRGFQYFVKLMDFGLARPRGEAYLPTESAMAGSFFYLAPELISGQPADISSDLYALGVTLYEMTTGRVPFSDFDEQAILSQHLEETAAPPSHSRKDVPPALEAIILRLLEKNPKDRFDSAQEARRALEQIPLAQESAARGNLPQLDFIGREDEIAQVKQLIESNRLVTLLGDGGELALAVGAQLTDQFSDGVWLAELESLTDPKLALQTVASLFGAGEDSNRPLTVSLIESLREKNLLLLLNHCDHVIFACAQLAETILRSCGEARILATSRQPLNIPAEKCYRSVGGTQ